MAQMVVVVAAVLFSVRCHLPPTSNFHTSVPRCATLKVNELEYFVLENPFKRLSLSMAFLSRKL
jgi:hypothetical protein